MKENPFSTKRWQLFLKSKGVCRALETSSNFHCLKTAEKH